jgi:hypothetical protein
MNNEEMHPDSAQTRVKKVYVKPVISKIRLVAEEAVLALCKLGNGNKVSCAPNPTCANTRRS